MFILVSTCDIDEVGVWAFRRRADALVVLRKEATLDEKLFKHPSIPVDDVVERVALTNFARVEFPNDQFKSYTLHSVSDGQSSSEPKWATLLKLCNNHDELVKLYSRLGKDMGG